MALSKLNHLPKVLTPISSHWELELQHTNFGGDTNIWSITDTKYGAVESAWSNG